MSDSRAFSFRIASKDWATIREQSLVPRGDMQPVDGIVFDEFGNPVAYYVLRQHPGDNAAFRSGGIEFDVMPVESVIHLYRTARPGQRRGIPEIYQ